MSAVLPEISFRYSGKHAVNDSKMGRTVITRSDKGKSKTRGQWSSDVSLDDKHRPQIWDAPSSTVRSAWCRSPQEAHILEAEGNRYRRLTVDEICVLQGFPPSWVDIPEMTRWDRVAALGNAVPPPLARAVIETVLDHRPTNNQTSLEICAGIGGLASAACGRLEHLALVENDASAVQILRHQKPWSATRVLADDVKALPLRRFRGAVGLLSGGPPCQPWSNAGNALGPADPRDLLAWTPHLISEVAPEAFVFENVPGLLSTAFSAHLEVILSSLRSPGSGLRYGVAVGLLNAANYGVPQLRKRVFLVGLRDAHNAAVHKVFDAIAEKATHKDPKRPKTGLRPWVTLREAIGHMPDPGGWRSWMSGGDTR
jgi:site-specific DNA-cytosine methylase